MPLEVASGRIVEFELALDARDPGDRSDCGPPERLAIALDYYDSVIDDYRGESSTRLEAEFDLDFEPLDVLPEERWACVGAVPMPSYPPGGAVSTVWVRELESGDVVPGAALRVCTLSDPACATPIDEGTTDIVGIWPLEIPTDTAFYFDVAIAGFVPTLFFEHVPPTVSHQRTLRPPLEAWLTSALSTLDLPNDPDLAHLAVELFDCDEAAAAGVTVHLVEEEAAAHYWQDGVVDPSLVESSSDGFATLHDLPPGAFHIEAVVAASGAVIARRSVELRAGSISFVRLDPTPTEP
jgi:hypothetical protein